MNPNQNQNNGGQPQYQQPQPQQSYGPTPLPSVQSSPNYGPAPSQPQQSYDTLPTPALSPVGRPSGHNPYEFIVNPNRPKPSALKMATSSNFLRVVVLAVVGIMLLFTLIGFAASHLSSSKNITAELITQAQEQQEIIRLTTLANTNVTSRGAKNLMVNTQLSMITSQNNTKAYLTLTGRKLGAKDLALKKDSKTDTLFASAKSSGTFDKTFRDTLETQLTAYATDVQAAYKIASTPKSKELLKNNFNAAELLLKEIKIDNAN